MSVFRGFPTPSADAPSTADAKLDRLARDYFDGYLESHPSAATYLGIHDFDARLEEAHDAVADARLRSLTTTQQAVSELRGQTLSAEAALDLELLSAAVEGERLYWQRARNFERDPREVNETISWGILPLVQRSFAPLEERGRAVLGRLAEVPRALADSRRSLKNPARILTELALEEFPGGLEFITSALPAAFEPLGDSPMRGRIREACGRAAEAYREHLRWLEEDLLPRSGGSFAIGPELYREKLRLCEGIETPLERLLEEAWLELRRLQEDFAEAASRLAPGEEPSALLERLAADHPRAEELLEAGRSTLAELREFCLSAGLLSLPDAPDPRVLETPSFARDLAFAMMDTPGPFEEVATEAYYYITLPYPDWPPERTEEFLRMFSRPGLRVIGAHEVYPGHYAQLLRVRETQTVTRRMADSGLFVEGWAHYCEEMLLQAGYGEGDLGLRLAQIHEALLRCCRFIAGISLHCLGMTVEEATDLFLREGYQAPPSAEMEAKRGTTDPHYLIYTLGKLRIKQLREECREAWGSGFTLRRFHDALLRNGSMPVALHRKALLAG